MVQSHLCKEDYEEVKRQVGMRQAAQFYGYPADRQGRCLCPFHDDRRPSMKVYPNNKGYYCFSCGNGGDVIKFVGRLYGLGNEPAALKIIRDFSLPIKTEGLTYREKREREKKIRQRRELDAFYGYAYATLQAYRQLLCEAIRDPGSPHFVEAAQGLSIVEYKLDCLDRDLEGYYKDKGAAREIGKIRDRIIGWHG